MPDSHKDAPKSKEIPPVDEVIIAWVYEGPYPEYHRQAVWRLRKEWPALANSLDKLVRSRGVTPPKGIRPPDARWSR